MDESINCSIKQLKYILNHAQEKRISIVGTSCIGKSYLARYLDGAVDMDNVLFPYLTKREEESVCVEPWTPQVGENMEKLARKYLQIQPGRPMLGTIIFDSDLIVHLRASDFLLVKRVKSRKANYSDCVNMAKWIENRVKNSKIPHIDFLLG